MVLLLLIKECLKCKVVIGTDIRSIKLLIYLHHGKEFFLAIVFCMLTSCFNYYYYLRKDENMVPIVEDKLYLLNKTMSFENSKIIDTTSLYIEQGKNKSMLEIENPFIIIFHNNGMYELRSKKYFQNI